MFEHPIFYMATAQKDPQIGLLDYRAGRAGVTPHNPGLEHGVHANP